MRPTTAIVTAADAGYFELLADLVTSIRDKPEGRAMPICVLDLGLTAEQRAWLAPQVQQVKRPGWDIAFPGVERQPEHFKAMVARPFLPAYFPDYEALLWLDSDLWVQDWSAIETFLLALERHGFAITAALDRSYAFVYNRGNVRRMIHGVLAKSFDQATADAVAALPVMNSGAFVLPRQSPVWQAWQERLAHALQRHHHHMIEQCALNVVIYAQPRLPHLLPAVCNWMCMHALPAFDPAGRRLVEPFLPHVPLGLVHLGGGIKRQPEAPLQLTTGGTVTVPLTYRAFTRFRDSFAAAKAG